MASRLAGAQWTRPQRLQRPRGKTYRFECKSSCSKEVEAQPSQQRGTNRNGPNKVRTNMGPHVVLLALLRSRCLLHLKRLMCAPKRRFGRSDTATLHAETKYACRSIDVDHMTVRQSLSQAVSDLYFPSCREGFVCVMIRLSSRLRASVACRRAFASSSSNRIFEVTDDDFQALVLE